MRVNFEFFISASFLAVCPVLRWAARRRILTEPTLKRCTCY